MEASENIILPFQQSKNLHNKIKTKESKEELNNLEENYINNNIEHIDEQEEIGNNNFKEKSFLKRFLTSKKGIIILVFIGIILVISIIVSIVATKKSSLNDKKEANVILKGDSKNNSGRNNGNNSENDNDLNKDENNERNDNKQENTDENTENISIYNISELNETIEYLSS